MLGSVKSYDIHGLITAKTNIDLNIPERFRTKKTIQNPDIRIVSGDVDLSVPHSDMKQRKDYAYYRNNDNVVIDYGALDLAISIESIEDNFKVIVSKRYEKANIGHIRGIWEIALHLKLLQQNHILFHAGCIDFDDAGILIPGLGSTGKTYTTLSLVDGDEYRYLSDDLVILGPNGSIYSYPQPTGIGPYTIDNDSLADEVDQSMLIEKLAKIPLFSIIFGKYPQLYKSRQIEIPDNMIVDNSQANYLFLITGDGDGVTETELGDVVDKLMTQHFDTNKLMNNHIINSYCFLTGFNIVDQFAETKSVLQESLTNTSCYELNDVEKAEYPELISQIVNQ